MTDMTIQTVNPLTEQVLTTYPMMSDNEAIDIGDDSTARLHDRLAELGGIGGQLGSAQMFTVSGWQLNDRDLASNNLAGNNVSEIGWPFPADGFNVDLWPIGAALAIVAIGIAFRYGETLQADAERITRRNLQLRRDTDGLI